MDDPYILFSAEKIKDVQSIMPVLVLGLFQGASWTRYVRSAMLDVIRLDYVTTARSKGLREYAVIMKHVVRNALIPVVTLVALTMPQVFGGAIVTEQIFRVPGIGSLLISAILANDMHLGLRVPNTWYRASIVRPDAVGGTLQVTGVTLPPGLRSLAIVSRVWVPAHMEPAGEDTRLVAAGRKDPTPPIVS